VTAFVAPDVHGNIDLLTRLLQTAGIIDGQGKRVDGDTLTVQLGDLCNCVASSTIEDRRCLDQVRDWFDVYLVGNHEHPYFGGPPFAGFWHDVEIERRLHRLNDEGLLRPCVAVDGILVSHAGLAPWCRFRTAATAERALCDLWRLNPKDAAFSTIGRARGGYNETGGVLWSDWSEPKNPWFWQLVGHTPGAGVRTLTHPNGKKAVCIDVGGKSGATLTGAFIYNGEVGFVNTAGERVAA
jgi:hypothetical protein